MNHKTVTIFGVFDGIHEGHRVFIREAKTKGDKLVAVVTRDEMVKKIKNKLPLKNEVDRINELVKVPDIDLVFLGDKDLGTYNILKEIKPDIVYLGYDQQNLFDSITKAIDDKVLPEIELVYGRAHKGDTLHSSLINK
ncbi:MAG: adenylyltransferase/cytidyltransferase family protein [Patescibacteria group bacterium]|nr:adenylyltransferase/cytidyltransferase family protein [Patescibacteria group bacterium]